MDLDNEGAAAPTDGQAVIAPAESEKATLDAGVRDLDAVPENAEPKAEETEQTAEDGDAASDEPKRLTRNQRLQRKAARLSTMVAEQAAELEKFRQATAKSSAEGSPKEADFNGDYFAFQTAKAAYDAAQLIRKDLNDRDERAMSSRLQERRQEASEDFQERAEQIKASIPDFDKTIGEFEKAGGKFAPHVVEELLESDKGPMLAYQLAKQPGLAAELNAMSPRDAAREIGRLEAKVVLPQQRKQTQAPPPVAPLNGGGSPKSAEADLDSWLKKTYG
jgi:hypothetical protein